jgi:hypothetical protein
MDVFMLKIGRKMLIEEVFPTLDGAKLACEAQFGGGQWNQDGADQWTLQSHSDTQEIVRIVRCDLQV